MDKEELSGAIWLLENSMDNIPDYLKGGVKGGVETLLEAASRYSEALS